MPADTEDTEPAREGNEHYLLLALLQTGLGEVDASRGCVVIAHALPRPLVHIAPDGVPLEDDICTTGHRLLLIDGVALPRDPEEPE